MACTPPLCPTVKVLCNLSTTPQTTEGQALLALWDQICPNFDPYYTPPPPPERTPVCAYDCLPANPALEIIFAEIADLLEK